MSCSHSHLTLVPSKNLEFAGAGEENHNFEFESSRKRKSQSLLFHLAEK
jgi:hypothetical protein